MNFVAWHFMKSTYPLKRLLYFYENYRHRSPLKVLFLMFLTFGFYFIYWIYTMNVKLSEIDEDTPDPKRGLIITLLFPVFWFFSMFIVSNFILPGFAYNSYLSVFGWLLISFLSMKYNYEFCCSFSKVTCSQPGLVWYLFLYPGYFSLILLVLNFYYTFPLIFFPLITIPAMQDFINKRAKQTMMKRAAQHFNYMTNTGSLD